MPQCKVMKLHLTWGEVEGLWDLARIIRSSNLLQGRFHSPDLPGVLTDGAVAGELSTASDVMDHHLGPLFRVL